MADFRPAIERLLTEERQKLVPDDNGKGAARWGITVEFARETLHVNEPERFVRELTRQQAFNIYLTHFWKKFRLGEIESQRIATIMLFAVVNMGPDRPITYIQEACNAIRTRHTLAVDGRIGRFTLGAINEIWYRGEDAEGDLVVRVNNALREEYHRLARENPKKYGDDLRGWMNRVARAAAVTEDSERRRSFA